MEQRVLVGLGGDDCLLVEARLMIQSPHYWPSRDAIDRHRQIVAGPIVTPRRSLLRWVLDAMRGRA